MDHEPTDPERSNSPKHPKWRHILPISQTLVYLALVVWGLNEFHRFGTHQRPPAAHILPVQEGISFEPEFIDGPIPRSVKMAFAINLPALLPGAMVSLPVVTLVHDLTQLAGDIVVTTSIGLFVPGLWYSVGWWIDNRMGRSPPRLLQVSLLCQEILVAMTLIVCLPLFAIAVLGLVSVTINRYPDQIEVFCGTLGWTGWFSWAALSKALRWRRIASDRSKPAGAAGLNHE